MLRHRSSKRREAFPEVLNECMATSQDVSGCSLLEAAHRPESLLEVTVVALQSIVEVSGATMLSVG